MSKKRPTQQQAPPRIVIVGNGPSAARFEIGPYIDGFDEVMRINAFNVLAEFVPYVGKRTTVWARSHAFKSRKLQSPIAAILNIFPSRTSSPDRTPTIRRKVPKIDFPSTGLSLLHHLISQGIRPYAIGLDGYVRGEQRNYWSDDLISEEDPHDWQAEQAYMVEAQEAGLYVDLEVEIEAGRIR